VSCCSEGGTIVDIHEGVASMKLKVNSLRLKENEDIVSTLCPMTHRTV
jgi:hypothetical protein